MLAEWVETRRFSTSRLRPGYDQEEVDAFLAEIRDSFLGVRQPSLTSGEIRNEQFSTTSLRSGYNKGEVDAFLDEAESRLPAQVVVSGATPGKNPDNSARQPLTGRKLWWRLFMRQGIDSVVYYKDSAFPACPACGSPNTMVTQSWNRRGHSYLCLEPDCKSKTGLCEVQGSDGVAQRKANIRRSILAAALIILALVVFVLLPDPFPS